MWPLASTAVAQSTGAIIRNNPGLGQLLGKIMNFIVIPIVDGLFIFTFLMFVWGVVQLIRNGDDPKAREDGQRHILWGIIGLTIMVSAYGIVRLISATVGGGDPYV